MKSQSAKETEWFGRRTWNLEIPSPSPALTTSWIFFDIVPGSAPRLRLYIANWSASGQLGFLTY